MRTKIGINGFGRIGRQVLRAIIERHNSELQVTAINSPYDVATNAHLFRYDSVYGRFDGRVETPGGNLAVNGEEMEIFSTRDPGAIPWKKFGAEIVLECTGSLTDATKAGAHIEKGGAKKVIISAPAKGEDKTIVLGVNEDSYDPRRHNVISNASCTTNALAPPVFVIHRTFGVEKGLMNTVHAVTNDQRLLDQPHKDRRRARAAHLNIIPTTTGAAKGLSLVIPDMAGRFDGFSLRVPTPTVSVVDFTVILSKNTSTKDLGEVLREASENSLKGILGFDLEGLVSSDYTGCPLSSIVDGNFIQVLGGNFAKLISFYDNEWAYACRLSDLAALVASKGFY
jgi:glyceraldehyde 3-phosphate dehydrogenase